MRMEDSEKFTRMRGGVLYRMQDHFDFLAGPEIARSIHFQTTVLRGARILAPRKIEVYMISLSAHREKVFLIQCTMNNSLDACTGSCIMGRINLKGRLIS